MKFKRTSVLPFLGLIAVESLSVGSALASEHRITEVFQSESGWTIGYRVGFASGISDIEPLVKQQNRWLLPDNLKSNQGFIAKQVSDEATISLHPGDNQYNPVAYWTSPYDGYRKIEIQGHFKNAVKQDWNGVKVSIFVNQKLVYGPVLIADQDMSEHSFDLVQYVTKGDTVSFQVNNAYEGKDQHDIFWGDETLLKANLVVSDQSVEPPTHLSSIEHSTEQGDLNDDDRNNDWLYQYRLGNFSLNNEKIYNLEANHDNPRYFPISNGGITNSDYMSKSWTTAMLTRVWQNKHRYIRITPSQMHPDEELDAVKTWVNTSNQPKDIVIEGRVAKANGMIKGDGIRALILKQNQLLWGPEIVTDNQGKTHNIRTTVLPGERIHFIVNKNGNTAYDITHWDPALTVSDSQLVNQAEAQTLQATIPSSSTQGATYTFAQTDHGEALNNPGMGLHFAYYDNFLQHYGDGTAKSDTLDYFEGMNIVYLRVPWSFIEQQDDVFQWERLDSVIRHWKAKGKRVGMRFTSHEVEEQAAPLWLRDDKGAGGFMRSSYTFDQPWIPNSWDTVFFNEYKEFMQAVATRYDNNPDVEFIEMGALGAWGEGHSQPISTQTWDKFAAMFEEVFTNTTILWPDDSRYIQPAVRHGFGMYDDSIGWNNNGGNTEAANQIWRNNPVRVEMTHYYESAPHVLFTTQPGFVLEAVERIHGSYFLVHAYADRYWDEQKEYVRKMNQRIGYRFNFPSISWPGSVTADTLVETQLNIRNAGVAPNYQGGYVTLTLKDQQENIVSKTTETGFNTKDLYVSDQQVGKTGYEPNEVTNLTLSYKAPATPGTYNLYVSVGLSDGTPVYELPYHNNDGEKRYAIGSLTVE